MQNSDFLFISVLYTEYMESKVPNRFTDNFYQIFMEEVTTIL